MGLNSIQQNMQSAGLAGIDRLARNAMFPQSQMDKTQYAVSSQMPTSAEVMQSDYDAKTDAYTGLPTQPFKRGGITSVKRFNGEDGSGVDVSGNTGWDPEKGAVKLQKLKDPNDPFSDVTTVDYTIPKDTIKQFIPDIDPETNAGLGSGQYILNDGSTMRVASDGIVQSATPSRSDYTLNKEGYYQPTGENLTWRGDQNMLYKKIGGVDVNVPGIFHKGGYQDQQGNLRVDANGVPLPLAPNYLDSGAGQSGLADAAPYIMAATMMAMTGLPVGFEGMVPASETLMGGLGAASTGTGLTTADILGSSFGGSQFAIDPAAAYTAAGAGAGAAEAGGAAAGEAASKGFGLKDAYNAYKYANLAKNVLGMTGALGGGSTGYSGQGINPNSGYVPFNPGVRAGLPISSGYEKTPWANMAPPITLSKLSDFAPEKDMSSGGKAESDNIFDSIAAKEKKLVELELMAQSLSRRPGEEYSGMPVPQGTFGRVGASSELDENSRIRAGLSGIAMAVPGQHGVKAIPGSMDIGYNTQAGPGNLDLSAFRSINPIPGRGHAQGLNARYTIPFAQGGDIGHLGGYSDGGRLLKGPGDGMSDNIPASIDNKQPARLADGEFVVPADVVSHLGNGSTDAGAKQLYAMMDKVREARTGNKKQGKQIKPSKFLPKG